MNLILVVSPLLLLASLSTASRVELSGYDLENSSKQAVYFPVHEIELAVLIVFDASKVS